MLLRIVGSILVITACILYAYQQGRGYQRYVAALQDIYQIVLILKGEISYTQAPLGEVFHTLANRITKPYQTWFRGMESEVQYKSGTEFAVIWRRGVEEELKELNLKTGHKELLAELGNYLGQLDLKTGIGSMELFLERLKLEIEKERAELIIKKRLCNCLGVMVGLFLVILFM